MTDYCWQHRQQNYLTPFCLSSMLAITLMDTPENTDKIFNKTGSHNSLKKQKKLSNKINNATNLTTKQTHTTFSRNRQTKLFQQDKQNFLQETNKIFPTRTRTRMGRWYLSIWPGQENIGVPSNPFHMPDRDPTKQIQTMTHQEACINACCIFQH